MKKDEKGIVKSLKRASSRRFRGGFQDSFASLLRFAFVLLQSRDRREAIKVMDSRLRRLEALGRPFHETRQHRGRLPHLLESTSLLYINDILD